MNEVRKIGSTLLMKSLTCVQHFFQEVLLLMHERTKRVYSNSYPDTRTYSHVLAILTKDIKMDVSKKIFDVIQMMEDDEDKRRVFLFDNIGKIDTDIIY